MKQNITPFGKHLRMMRVDLEISQAEMSNKMGYSANYLSALEIGKKSIPNNFIDKFKEAFGLSSVQEALLQNKIDASPRLVKIPLIGSSDEDRILVSLFAQKFSKLNSENRAKLISLLESEDNHHNQDDQNDCSLYSL